MRGALKHQMDLQKARTRRSMRDRTEAVSGCHDSTQPVPSRGMRLGRKRIAPSETTSPLLTACSGSACDIRSAGKRFTPRSATFGVALHRPAPGILRAAPWRPRWRPMAAAAIAVSLVALVGHAAVLHPEAHRPHHHSHALLSEVGGAFTVSVNHAHLVNGSLTECHDVLAAAVLPRTAATFADLGVAVATLAIIAALASRVAASVRGPPHVSPIALAGQDLLRRFCLSRR